MLTLDHAKVGKMTGWQLLELVGHDRTIGDRHNASFSIGTYTWHVYITTARGRTKGTYIHLWTQTEAKVVYPDGSDTGSRTTHYIHFRGTVGQRIEELEEIA